MAPTTIGAGPGVKCGARRLGSSVDGAGYATSDLPMGRWTTALSSGIRRSLSVLSGGTWPGPPPSVESCRHE